MKILIDTHILIWLLDDNPKLSEKHKFLLENLDNQLFISQFSFMELAIKLKLGKLPDFHFSMEEFIVEVERSGIKTITVENKHFQTYQDLPLFDDHRDPFDRFIIATAIYEKLNLISADTKFTKYASLVSIL